MVYSNTLGKKLSSKRLLILIPFASGRSVSRRASERAAADRRALDTLHGVRSEAIGELLQIEAARFKVLAERFNPAVGPRPRIRGVRHKTGDFAAYVAERVVLRGWGLLHGDDPV